MNRDTLPPHLRQMIASRPDVQVKSTITVDPLVMDGLRMERSLRNAAQFMESRHWDSERDAKIFLQNIMPFASTNDESASEMSEELIAEAYEATNKIVRLSKVNEALRLFPQCAHAYLLLAMEEADSSQKIALLREGMAIAETAIEPGAFVESDEYFWDRVETRPYMRCRTALSQALWDNGDCSQAINHRKELLKLNRQDNQGLRFHLASWLLENNPDNLYIRQPFFKDYKADTSAFIQYAYALWLFHKQGPRQASTNALLRAIKHNRYVPVFLLEKAQIPPINLYRVERGSPEEAVSYCRVASSCWKKFPGSLYWLSANVGQVSAKLIQTAESAKQCDLDGLTFAGMPLNLTFE